MKRINAGGKRDGKEERGKMEKISGVESFGKGDRRGRKFWERKCYNSSKLGGWKGRRGRGENGRKVLGKKVVK